MPHTFALHRPPPVSLQNSAAGTGAAAVSLLCDAPAAQGVGLCAFAVPNKGGAALLELQLGAAETADAQAWSADGATLALGVACELRVYGVAAAGGGGEGRAAALLWRAALPFQCKAAAVCRSAAGRLLVAVGGADGLLLFPAPPAAIGAEPEPEPEVPLADAPWVEPCLSLLHHEPICCLAFETEATGEAGECQELAAGTVDGRLVCCSVSLPGGGGAPSCARTAAWPLGEEGGGGLRRVTTLSYRPGGGALAVACWDGSVHILSPRGSSPERRWQPPRLVHDAAGGDAAAMLGAAFLCWSPAGEAVVLALGGRLQILRDIRSPMADPDSSVLVGWGDECGPKDWEALETGCDGGQIKGLASVAGHLVAVGRVVDSDISVHPQFGRNDGADDAESSLLMNTRLAAVAEHRSSEEQRAPAAAVAVAKQPTVGLCEVRCLEWSKVCPPVVAIGDTGPDGAVCVQCDAGSVCRASADSGGDLSDHCVVAVHWADTATRTTVPLGFAPADTPILPYTPKDNGKEEGGTSSLAESLRVLLGVWGMAVLYDGTVYLWERPKEDGLEGQWRLVVTQCEARALCVGCVEQRRWLLMEDVQAGVMALRFKGSGPEGSTVDGDSGLWTRGQKALALHQALPEPEEEEVVVLQ